MPGSDLETRATPLITDKSPTAKKEEHVPGQYADLLKNIEMEAEMAQKTKLKTQMMD